MRPNLICMPFLNCMHVRTADRKTCLTLTCMRDFFGNIKLDPNIRLYKRPANWFALVHCIVHIIKVNQLYHLTITDIKSVHRFYYKKGISCINSNKI